jgi:hypothetical protein
VRRAAVEFWFNEALTLSHVLPLISTLREKKEMLLGIRFSLLEVCLSFAFLGTGSWPTLNHGLAVQQRAHCPRAMAPEQFPLLPQRLLSPVG